MGGLSALFYAGGEISRGWMIASLVARSLVAAFFVFLAWKNLSNDPQMVADFQRWGFPEWFRRTTSLLQIVGALMLVPTATCFLGGVLLAFILLGAAGTHLMYDPLSASVSPIAFLIIVAGTTAWFRPPLFQ